MIVFRLIYWQLADSEFSKVYSTLELFSYGVYLDYTGKLIRWPNSSICVYLWLSHNTGNPSKFLDLSPNQLNKLRHLTILSLVQSRKVWSYHVSFLINSWVQSPPQIVSYDVLLKNLSLTSTRELEDMVMEVIMTVSERYSHRPILLSNCHLGVTGSKDRSKELQSTYHQFNGQRLSNKGYSQLDTAVTKLVRVSLFCLNDHSWKKAFFYVIYRKDNCHNINASLQTTLR
jgi:hypothetical protein